MINCAPASYTPGPWHEHSHRQIGPAAGIVCEVWSAIGETDADAIAQADANCRLIAAAPDLLEALVALLQDPAADTSRLRPKTMKAVRAALNAVAARGQSC